MVITLADWQFRVEREQTMAHSLNCSVDHCMCAYCRNYYETVDRAHPSLRSFLERFGVVLEGPSEVMPLEPTVVMACYRVMGEILHRGQARMHVNNVPIHPEEGDSDSFLLWVGEMELPWEQAEPADDVVSPANQPEFLERMAKKWAELNEIDLIIS